VPVQVDLGLLAAAAGLETADLAWPNKELLYGVTPPGDARADPAKGYHLKVRGKHQAAVETALAEGGFELLKYYWHTIAYGDTLSALARHYKVTVEQIIAANPGIKARSLQLNKRLRIPALAEVAPYVNEYSAGAGAAAASFTGSYKVVKDDTLWSLALRYSVSPDALAEANNMGLNDTLSIGRTLKVPIM
jgi:LysM repeat protein